MPCLFAMAASLSVSNLSQFGLSSKSEVSLH
jgi:hypothetical protein